MTDIQHVKRCIIIIIIIIITSSVKGFVNCIELSHLFHIVFIYSFI